ncbi:MAG TPA: hypothetical protein DCP51_09170 [Clostridiales bacterium]|nr:hypothetical protein [Clostridiales bacterium]
MFIFITIPFCGVYATSGSCAVPALSRITAPLAVKVQNRSLKIYFKLSTSNILFKYIIYYNAIYFKHLNIIPFLTKNFWMIFI